MTVSHGTMPTDGQRVRFAPNPRMPDLIVEAIVVRRRSDPRSRASGQGWLDTRDDGGVERSVRPSRCEVVG